VLGGAPPFSPFVGQGALNGETRCVCFVSFCLDVLGAAMMQHRLQHPSLVGSVWQAVDLGASMVVFADQGFA